ncbi:phosphatase PAP2 family protein [Alteromonas ponticola]|uniref:undecaprenyl-diphosphate phosphatase n=1 Tax=Alteromonas ponticola TaxID=2720613 RepID=A0ABX1QXA1_9ALTE|nr:phosphatase PAP2 family protein [Alteromonas ponticola]NMH58879.1 phosphatase PAP2 family protein [Alteromonas ponticola]
MRLKKLTQHFPASIDLPFIIVSAICCFAIWTFIELADDAPEGDYLEIENKVLTFFRSAENPEQAIGPFWVEQTALEITSLGSIPVLTLIVVLCVLHMLLIRKYGMAILLTLSTVLGGALTFLLKDIFERARPDKVSALVDVMTYSFPSGHAMTSSIVFMTLGALLAQTVSNNLEKAYFIATALFLSFAIGFTRVYLGVHYPTDVMAGWAAGTAWALICWSIPHVFVRIRRTYSKSEKLL